MFYIELDPSREKKLNDIDFVWNTVTAMWEDRFRRLSEWRKIHGHCAVPIAQGELGTWVSKQRQLRKRNKLSKEKIDALNSLGFTWSTAEAEWEYKFKRLCEWTKERGHASVPFNEGELGWWVNTQRQTKRKGKLHPSREARLQSLGFVWNPSITRSQRHNSIAMSSASTTPTSTPEKTDKLMSQESTEAILKMISEQRTNQKICDYGAKNEGVTLLGSLKLESGSSWNKEREESISLELNVKEEHQAFVHDNPSPISAEHTSGIGSTPQPGCIDSVPPPPLPIFLTHNLWSPTILSSPMFISSMNGIPGENNFQIPSSGCQPLTGFENANTIQAHSDALEQLLARDDTCDTSYNGSMTCQEDV